MTDIQEELDTQKRMTRCIANRAATEVVQSEETKKLIKDLSLRRYLVKSDLTHLIESV
jgi:hypothetical protein